MAKELFLHKGLSFEGDSVTTRGFSFTRWLRRQLVKWNVPFYDPCCPNASTLFPAGVGDDGLVYFNGTALVPITELPDAGTVGTVTQITSKTTGVTLNTNKGVITTVALTDAADTSFVFTLTNSNITATSHIILTALNSGNGSAHVEQVSQTAGSAVIKVTNIGTAAFNSLIKINYTIT